MSYALLKSLHILSATILFGTGLGTAYFMWSALQTRDSRVLAKVSHHVVRADWLFTTPTVLLQPLTGWWLMQQAGFAWEPWLITAFVLYIIAGVCWLPVVGLQIRMRNAAQHAVSYAHNLPPQFWRDARTWFWLGIPAFTSMVAVFFLMVFKHV